MTYPPPKQTWLCPEGTLTLTAARVEHGTPVGYKLMQKLDGSLVLRGAFQWSQGMNGGIEWRDIPTEIEKENTK